MKQKEQKLYTLPPRGLSETEELAKALSDKQRLIILSVLKRYQKEVCSCYFAELLSLAPSTVSAHLAILYRCGLVEKRKEGRWVHFRLKEQKNNFQETILQEVLQNCEEDFLFHYGTQCKEVLSLSEAEQEEQCRKK